MLDAGVGCVPGIGWSDPIGVNFHHQARRLYGTAGETRTYVVHARTMFDSAAPESYTWRVTATSGDTATSAMLSRIAYDWDQSVDDLEIDATATDDLYLEFSSTDPAAKCSLCDLSIYEKVA